jgi:hypothetical protein
MPIHTPHDVTGRPRGSRFQCIEPKNGVALSLRNEMRPRTWRRKIILPARYAGGHQPSLLFNRDCENTMAAGFKRQ